MPTIVIIAFSFSAVAVIGALVLMCMEIDDFVKKALKYIDGKMER